MKDFDVSKLTGEQINTHFCVSVQQDDGMALFWLEAGADVNSRFEGEPVLLYAIENDNEELAIKLIELGADVNVFDSENDPILFHALNDVKWLNILANGDLDINIKNPGNYNAFSIAYKKDKEDVADRLVELGIEVERSLIKGVPILIACVSWNKGRWLDKLLSLKLDVNARDEDCCSALIWAVKRNNEYAVDKLIEAGAEVNLQDFEGSTALMFVRSYAIADKLIKSGANPNIANKYNENAIRRCLETYAEVSYYHTEEMENICELLIRNDAEHNVYERTSLLNFAYKAKSKKLAKLIKEVYEKRKFTYRKL